MINLIAVISEQTRAIGKDGGLLWDIPTDLARFRSLTRGQVVVMGRSTWDSLPANHRPLPNRVNIVITRDEHFSAQGAFVAHSLAEALQLAAEEGATGEPVWIIGGGQIYELALPMADNLYLTLVEGSADGDAHFPDYSDFVETERSPVQEENGYRFVFTRYTRRASNS